jgi:hypothetical protein
MRNLKNERQPERDAFDRNYDSALERVVAAYAKRGAPDEGHLHELKLQLDLLTTHTLRMFEELAVLRGDLPAPSEFDWKP